jgi:hypothetical protein
VTASAQMPDPGFATVDLAAILDRELVIQDSAEPEPPGLLAFLTERVFLAVGPCFPVPQAVVPALARGSP